MQNIAIFGNGKLATALVTGLLKAGYKPLSITVIVREESKSDLSFFTSAGVRVSRTTEHVKDASIIFLVVTPQAVGSLLLRLKEVKFDRSRTYEIISFTSGLTRGDIGEAFPSKLERRVVLATCNTNIESCNGVIFTDTYSPILEKLGQMLTGSFTDIIRAIVSIGSGNAFACTALSFGYESDPRSISVFQWLTELLVEIETNGLQRSQTASFYDSVNKYMNALVWTYKTKLGYSFDRAEEVVLLATKSTIKNILSKGEMLTIDSIFSLRASVITKGGSTEKGINKLVSLQDVCSSEHLTDEVVSPILKRTLQFIGESHESAKHALLQQVDRKKVA